MGDVSHSQKDLESTEYRKNTYRDCYLPTGFNIASLAEVGFYFTRRGNIVKCFKCSIEVDLSNTDAKTNLIVLHKRLNSECQFAKELIELPAVPSQQRSKTFLSYDSLRYECERLETFIDWPVAFLMPADLAADGFYYLRTADHCACVFCRGIVGAWEEGDTPRGEHERHFSHCPFIRGQPVGNVPISQSNILSKLPPGASAQPQQPCIVPLNKGLDEVGSRHMPGSYPECMGPQMNEINLEDMGLPQYSGPKRKDFLTKDSRLESFNKWPERVTQKPVDLAESGFFYCGLSDHVRCFHCGNGLRNWEAEDCPWKEHARWYPDCNYILLKKGQEFVDTVRREKPPYKRSQNNEESLNGNKVTTNQPSTSSTPARPSITDAELDRLMELDIPRAVLGMGFPQRTVRATLKQKLEQTGLPFFSLEPCIEAVLQFMEDETRQTLNEAVPELEDEATQEQEAKLQNISSRSNAVGAQATSSGPSASTSTSEISVTISGESEEGAAGLSDPSTNERGAVSQDELAGASSINIEVDPSPAPSVPTAQASGNIAVLPSPTPCVSATSPSVPSINNRVAVPQHLPEDELPQASSNIDVPPSLPSVSTSVPTITSIPEGEDIPPVPRGPVPKPRILSQPSPIVPISPTPVSEPVPHPTIPTQEHPVATVASSVPSVPSVPQEMSNIQISEMESSETPVEDEPMDVDEDDTSQPVPSTSTNITHTPPLDRVISQADEVMTVAEAILKVPASGPPSLEKTEESSSSSSSSSSSTSQESKERQRENVENPVTPVGSTATGISKSLPQQSSQNLAEELEKIRDMRTCKVCMDAEMDVVFLPCAHMVTCSSCAATLAQCPICRANIRYTIKPIVS